MSEVVVRAESRVRLVSAVLAASHWPAYEQERSGTHAVHPHAKATRHYVQPFAAHPAVQTVNAALERGVEPAALFSVAVRCQWPTFEPLEPLPAPFADGKWARQLHDFYVESALAASFWSEHTAVWTEAEHDLQQAFTSDRLCRFLGALRPGALLQHIVIVPNLVYPATQTLVAASQDAYYVIIPPPKAVGESPPWPYRDGLDWVLAESCYQLLSHVLRPAANELTPEAWTLLRLAATIVFLEQGQDEAALFYRLRREKEWGRARIVRAVEQVHAFLAEPQARSLLTRFAGSGA